MQASYWWAERYVELQQDQKKSLYRAVKGRVVLTPAQLTDLVAWVHHCATHPGE